MKGEERIEALTLENKGLKKANKQLAAMNNHARIKSDKLDKFVGANDQIDSVVDKLYDIKTDGMSIKEQEALKDAIKTLREVVKKIS